jgi:hypothetical protein
VASKTDIVTGRVSQLASEQGHGGKTHKIGDFENFRFRPIALLNFRHDLSLIKSMVTMLFMASIAVTWNMTARA